ncbi:protein-disulfide reductase DsbD domain-containing protein, partial [Tepidimonas sp.]|uniref:protein-disulfide reductase DsbD domain-containing protein n=1 Tax=Tepidimonas sp. TaxID=2002775 RepID=UPI00260A657B
MRTMRETMWHWVRTLATALLFGLLPLWGNAQGRLVGLPGLTAAPAAAGDRARTEYAQVQLLAHAPLGVSAARPLWLGLRSEHEPEWHTYWRNPGDSGLPIELNWTWRDGVQIVAIEWPT